MQPADLAGMFYADESSQSSRSASSLAGAPLTQMPASRPMSSPVTVGPPPRTLSAGSSDRASDWQVQQA